MNSDISASSSFQSIFVFDAPNVTGAGSRTPEREIINGAHSLEQDGQAREHARHQTFRDNVNRAMIGMFWIVCAGLAGGIAVYCWHLLTPLLWHFLNDAQQVRLQQALAPALLSSALTGYVSRRIE